MTNNFGPDPGRAAFRSDQEGAYRFDNRDICLQSLGDAAKKTKSSGMRAATMISWLFAVIHIIAHVLLCISYLGFRFKDPINDIWTSWTFWRFAITSLLIFPLVTMVNIWINYQSRLIYFLHFLVCIVAIIWGVLQFAFLWVDWTNCNDTTLLIPDVPHCKNRDPSKSEPDDTFIIIFIVVSVETVLAMWWLIFSTIVFWFITGTLGMKIDSKLPSPVVEGYIRQVGSFIGEAFTHAYNNPKTIDRMPKEPQVFEHKNRKYHQ